MPCPYFEPQHAAIHSRHANARLPLIQEYDGLCHAGSEPVDAPPELRFECCNHGYSRGRCSRFPSEEVRSAMRYNVLRHTPTTLELVLIEEQNYVPLAWRPVSYFPDTGRFDPEFADTCIRAQALAFCRSYLERFSSSPRSEPLEWRAWGQNS